jgi:predicted PurR-regulated permease PerM
MNRDDFKFVTWAFTVLLIFFVAVGIFAGWEIILSIVLGAVIGAVASAVLYYLVMYVNKLLDWIYDRWINRS